MTSAVQGRRRINSALPRATSGKAAAISNFAKVADPDLLVFLGGAVIRAIFWRLPGANR